MSADDRDIGASRDGDRPEADGALRSFVRSDNVWILIPLTALSIPILAVTRDGVIGYFVGAVMVIAAITASVRYLLGVRHRLALEELEAKRRVALAERDRLDAIDRLVDDPVIRPVAEPLRRQADELEPPRSERPTP